MCPAPGHETWLGRRIVGKGAMPIKIGSQKSLNKERKNQMKKILYSIGLPLVIIALLFSAIGCEGPVGPQGAQGLEGVQGAAGPAGPAGATGAQGIRGATGPAGIPIVWLGALSKAPNYPDLNDAYYNSTHGISYVWDGKHWQVLAKDGAVGATGATGASGPRGYAGAAGPKGDTGAAGADGADGADGPQGLVGQIVAESSKEAYSPNLGPASDLYQAANVAGSVELGEGDWMIVASGAIEVTYVIGGYALNVGLRIGEGEAAVMLAKSNIASESMVSSEHVNRLGFALVGTVTVPEDETLEVELVHYGGGDDPPFEWNIVAIGGIAPPE
ncbi:hypothetical protein ES708_32629 [subsurface metagenome]